MGQFVTVGDGEDVRREVGQTRLPSMARYHEHLLATADWLLRSVKTAGSGSSAYYRPITGWSRAYPETTGYCIPTLLAVGNSVGAKRYQQAALDLGAWLVRIQSPEGSWPGGLFPDARAKPSLFNTGQVLNGMVALYHHTQDRTWLEAAHAGAMWIADQIDTAGNWKRPDYRSRAIPSYYAHMVFPMLEVWRVAQTPEIHQTALRVLRLLENRRRSNGAFDGWGFSEGRPAFTHTIAYTIWGFLKCARLLGDWSYGEHVRPALEVLLRKAELHGGALPGAFDQNWRQEGKYVCLTGNAQVALCILELDAKEPDLRLVSAAARLIDFVCTTQWTKGGWPGVSGGVAGSWPPWGRYMTLRYPNWAAKFHADAIMALSERLGERGYG